MKVRIQKRVEINGKTHLLRNVRKLEKKNIEYQQKAKYDFRNSSR